MPERQWRCAALREAATPEAAAGTRAGAWLNQRHGTGQEKHFGFIHMGLVNTQPALVHLEKLMEFMFLKAIGLAARG